MGHIFGLGLRRGQNIGQGIELGFKLAQRLQRLNGPRQMAHCTARVVTFKQHHRLVGAIHQGLGIGQTAVLGAQVLPFAIERVELFQLANLPRQSLAFVGQSALRLLRVGQILQGLSPGLPSCFERLGVNARISIEQAAHSFWTRQALPSVLPMNINQLLTQLAQLCGGGRAAIDPSTAFSGVVDRAAKQQLG